MLRFLSTLVATPLIWNLYLEIAHCQYTVSAASNGRAREVTFSGDPSEAPEILASLRVRDSGACAQAASGANFSLVLSQGNPQGGGAGGIVRAVSYVDGSELRILDDQALVDAIPQGDTHLDVLLRFDISLDAQAPDLVSYDYTHASLFLLVASFGFSDSVRGTHTLANGQISNQTGLFTGIPLEGNMLQVEMPGRLVPTGNGSMLTVTTSTNLTTTSWRSGRSELSLQLADTPIMRADGASFASLGITHEFMPPPVAYVPGSARCGSGSSENFWDIVRFSINPIVFSGGGGIESANVILLGSTGIQTLNILDVDATGNVAVGIPTDIAAAASDGFTVFGNDLNGDLLLSAPPGAIIAGSTFNSLFGSWTVADALASPTEFLLDPIVLSVLLSDLPLMGSSTPLDVELFTFDQVSEIAATFGDGQVFEAIEADFDMDGDVDTVDLQIWESNYGEQTYAVFQNGDSNVDGDIDGIDFLSWQRNYGATQSLEATSTVVPEPAALCLAGFGIVALFYARY